MSTRQADALRRVLAENDLSQLDLAKSAAVNKNTLTNILKGGPTSTPVLERLTEAVNGVRRKRGLALMDVAEWLATPGQAEALRRAREVEVKADSAAAIFQRIGPAIAQMIQDQLGATGGAPLTATGAPPEKVAQRPAQGEVAFRTGKAGRKAG